MKFMKHIVADMDESLVQRCLICGETICDYTNTMYPKGTPSPQGYAAGNVYVSQNRNPTISMIAEPTEHDIENCKP